MKDITVGQRKIEAAALLQEGDTRAIPGDAPGPQNEKDRSAVTGEALLARGCLLRGCPELLLLFEAAAAASWPAASLARRLSGRSLSERLCLLPPGLTESLLPGPPRPLRSWARLIGTWSLSEVLLSTMLTGSRSKLALND